MPNFMTSLPTASLYWQAVYSRPGSSPALANSAARKAGLRWAQQWLRQCLHHPLADLSRARIRRRTAELRIVGRRARLESKTDRDRRMLDGGRRTRPRPDVVRLPALGIRRSRAIAADPGRRLL